MGSLSTRRVVRRSAPAKITIVEGKGCGGGDVADKENMLNCSLYSLFETHYSRSNNNSPSKVVSPREPPAGGGTKDRMNNVLQPRKRVLNERTVPPPGGAGHHHLRELTPPELTTSDTFKPAKRTLPPNNNNKPEDEGLKQLPRIRTSPLPNSSESCDVLVSSPTELTQVTISDFQQCKAPTSAKRDVTKRTPTRRLSIRRLSIANREGGGAGVSSSSKKDGNSAAKRSPPTAEFAGGCPIEPNGKNIVFSAVKRAPLGDRARSKVSERRKSIGLKMSPVGKQGIGSFGGRSDGLKRAVSEKVGSAAAAQQQRNSAPKSASESIRTKKLAMALKSEQRLVEENELCRVQLRELRCQVEERDHEVENLRSAALLLNNLNNRQGDEIRELRSRLKETFNENAEVRHVCETLERELRKTRESLRSERLQNEAVTKPYEPNFVSLTSQLQSMTLFNVPNMPCIEEGQEEPERVDQERVDSESQESFEGSDDSSNAEGFEANGIAAESRTSITELPATQSDQDVQFTLEDLQDMVMHEEDLLKERCADALRELNLPLSRFLTPKGSLDVDSLKAMLVMLASKEEYFTAERVSSIRKLSAWLGKS